jgi:hypothetical protein
MANNPQLASDYFLSGSLAAGWSVLNGNNGLCAVTGTPPYYAQPVVANGSNVYGQLWTALTWPSDQISEATIQALSGTDLNQVVLVARFSYNGTYNQGYIAVIESATLQVYVNAGTGSGAVQLGSTVTGLTFASGDVWALAVVGACISVYQNGKRRFYIGDATIASGNTGFQLFATSVVTRCQVSSWRGYSAVQQDGIWQKQGAIFPATAAEVASSSPFGSGVTPLQGVLLEGNAQILSGTVYKSWFTAGDINGVGYSESLDGKTWVKYSGNPVISGYSNGIVNKIPIAFGAQPANTYWHWSQQSSAIGTGTMYVHTSSNGVSWSAATITNLTAASIGGSGVYLDLAVIDVISGTLYGVVAALNGTGGAPNTYLVSTTDGVNFTVLNGGTPVIANAFGLIQCVKSGGLYYLWCAANQPGQGSAVPNFDPLETVLYSSTQANLIAAGAWTFVHHSIHNTGMWESLNSNQAGVYATAVMYMPNLGRVGMFYEGSPGDSTGPQVYQGGLALAPPGSTIAAIVSQREDGAVAIASDNFPGSSLSASWSNMTGAAHPLAVGGGVCKASVADGGACIAVRTGEAYSPNQYSEFTITTLTDVNSFLTAGVRALTTSKTLYQCQIEGPVNTAISAIFGIYRQIAGVQTTLYIGNINTWQIGDVIRLSVVTGADGFPVLTMTQNGFVICQVQDQNSGFLTVGNPAMQVNALNAANATSALWAGGNAGVIPSYSSAAEDLGPGFDFTFRI